MTDAQTLETTDAPEPADAVRTFRTPTGVYRARVADGVVRALGIRYATADRFAPPVPVAPSDEPFDAFDPAPACPQRVPRTNEVMGDPLHTITFSEDCQRVSITLPADLAEGERVPVMVWIHGGSYVFGAGDLPLFDPSTLVREQRVIVVAVTYRLGVLGFLGNGGDIPANLGLLDLREALRWVHANIDAFGGDATSITLFGQSAGGDAVAHLMISDGVDGLFRRVIIQSAPFGLRSRRARMNRIMAAATGPLDADTPLPVLQEAEARAEKAAGRFGLRAGMSFGTQYGFAPLPPEKEALDAWRAVADRYDVLIGWTAEETSLFAEILPPLQKLFALPRLGPVLRSMLLDFTTDRVYRSSGRRFASLLARGGAKVTRYELAWRPRGSRMGATHTVELPLLFPGPLWRRAGVLGQVKPRELSAIGRGFRALWADFARTGALPADATASAGVPITIERARIR
ncbi:carboxylesterase family protein [Herbiconiux sp. L3-i23]|uniref:carboxylesterase family protein n=1 Tax=Herbiconiux sp. L3-i23 TaxID=2905871 RepID=UPI0020603B80|nr:carboxylesterase family protein [Herbiconiux sp. L3-i23]BDI23682.1 carboxylic ester hydrolase [Herbiconiux sp. L3-i23]